MFIVSLENKINDKKMALIGQAVSEKKMFDDNGYVHVYSPGTGADNPPGVKFFSLTVLFSQSSPLLQVFLHYIDFIKVFTIQKYR